ncbi:MAG: N-acetyltransferase [Stagnimonas sp.]|nr:N-acetyltransferase [Stagnimonas sp.]
MSAARIRRGRPQDLETLLALESLFPSDRLSRRGWRRFLSSPRASVLVACRGREVLGDLVLLRRAGSSRTRIYSLVVAPAARGQGLGEALVAAAERETRARGGTAVSLEVRTDNAAARALYAKRGYLETRALPRYYGDGADGLRLLKPLSRGA